MNKNINTLNLSRAIARYVVQTAEEFYQSPDIHDGCSQAEMARVDFMTRNLENRGISLFDMAGITSQHAADIVGRVESEPKSNFMERAAMQINEAINLENLK